MPDNPYQSPTHAGDSLPQRKGLKACLTVLAVFGVGVLLVALLLPARRTDREPARRSACSNNLKQIALALSNYESVYHALPPAYTVDADGKPLHSWRTLILPFAEERKLYETIDLTKPWDDPANAEALKSEPSIFQCPSDAGLPSRTTYLACVAPRGCFRLTEPRRLTEITDDLSKTLMVIETPTDRAVPWMSPNDADEALLMSIGSGRRAHPGGMNAACCDGGIHFLSADTTEADLRALISIAGQDKMAEKF